MPIYEFACKKCKDSFQLLISFSRISEAKCPNCGSEKVTRLMSTFAARTSGSNGSSHSHGSGCASCGSGNCASCGHH